MVHNVIAFLQKTSLYVNADFVLITVIRHTYLKI